MSHQFIFKQLKLIFITALLARHPLFLSHPLPLTIFFSLSLSVNFSFFSLHTNTIIQQMAHIKYANEKGSVIPEEQDPHGDLPTLDQVLTRKTLPPVCLYNFYIIMRDRLKMEEVLDFYLDLQHHELLWKRYVKAMHRSGHLSESDLTEGFQSPRILSRLSNNYFNESPSPTNMMNRPSLGLGGALSSNITTNSKPPPSRKDIMESSQRLLLRYLVPSATKELTQLPEELKQALRKELEKPDPRDDPLLFEDAKDYLFDLMQRQVYPKFLRLKVWGNITLYQQLGRLVLGLLCLLAALTTSLSLIFLGYPQWGVRFWVGLFVLLLC